MPSTAATAREGNSIKKTLRKGICFRHNYCSCIIMFSFKDKLFYPWRIKCSISISSANCRWFSFAGTDTVPSSGFTFLVLLSILLLPCYYFASNFLKLFQWIVAFCHLFCHGILKLFPAFLHTFPGGLILRWMSEVRCQNSWICCPLKLLCKRKPNWDFIEQERERERERVRSTMNLLVSFANSERADGFLGFGRNLFSVH